MDGGVEIFWGDCNSLRHFLNCYYTVVQVIDVMSSSIFDELVQMSSGLDWYWLNLLTGIQLAVESKTFCKSISWEAMQK